MSAPVSVGRIVHYVDEHYRHLAAIVTHIHTDETIDVTAFPSGTGPRAGLDAGGVPVVEIRHDEAGDEPQTWHWPERVEVAP